MGVWPGSACYICRVFRLAPLLGALLCLALVSGCGYRLLRQADGRDLRISVVTLGNDSLEPGVELTVTRALREEFLRRAAPRLVSNPAAADWVVRGRVLPLEVRANSFDTVSLALEYQVEVVLELEIVAADGDRIVLDRSSLQQSELYLASADPEATRKNREEALRRIADILAGRVHDAVGLQLADRAERERIQAGTETVPLGDESS
jgi:hypothetical protein